jgi:hypothetical protein
VTAQYVTQQLYPLAFIAVDSFRRVLGAEA